MVCSNVRQGAAGPDEVGGHLLARGEMDHGISVEEKMPALWPASGMVSS